MKFPRNTRLLRSPFEVAPFAAVFFLFAMFLMLAALMPPPGIPLQLPAGGDLPSVDKPTVAVAIDSAGRYFLANQLVAERQLKSGLATAAKRAGPSLTLVIEADKSVTYEQLAHLTLLASRAGIQHALLATMPRPETSSQP